MINVSKIFHLQPSDSPSMAQLYSNTLESSPSPSQIGPSTLATGLDLMKRETSPTPVNPPPAHTGRYSTPSPTPVNPPPAHTGRYLTPSPTPVNPPPTHTGRYSTPSPTAVNAPPTHTGKYSTPKLYRSGTQICIKIRNKIPSDVSNQCSGESRIFQREEASIPIGGGRCQPIVRT